MHGWRRMIQDLYATENNLLSGDRLLSRSNAQIANIFYHEVASDVSGKRVFRGPPKKRTPLYGFWPATGRRSSGETKV